MTEGDTLTNALVGAVATVILTPFIPLAPLAGGAVSGYLQDGRSDDGLRVGAISGAIALVPVILFSFLVITIMGSILAGFGGPGAALGGFGTFLIVVVVLFAAIYVVGLSLLGGWIGNYLKVEADV